MATTTELPGSIPIRRTETPRTKPEDSALEFGTVFTDHMFLQDYEVGRGWYDPRIEPYQALVFDPAATVLHYAQAVFDGLMAFRQPEGGVRLFRPRTRGTSLYVRPTIVATEPYLGVRPSRTYLYYVILSPVGAYYGQGMKPVDILVTDTYVRAVEGGVGAAKTAGNYAASLYAAEEAKHKGYAQVLWLDGVHRKYLDEVGTMNIMLRIGDQVVTPPLSGSILPGVTRDSVLTILHDWGISVAERPISIDELLTAAANGTLREVWGTGTAAAISPVGELAYKDQQIEINGGQIGELTQRLYDTLLGIQYGEAPDPYGWMQDV